MPAAAAAFTTLVSLAFALSTFERWLDRRRPYELAWTIALAEFAAASAAQWWGAAAGWGGLSFRAFYLFGPILSVPELALGTVLLLAPAAAGRATRRAVHTWSLVSVGVLVAVPLTGAIDPAVLPQGSEVFGPLPRALAAIGAGLGATVLIAGAVWSAARLARRRGTGRLVAANSLIAVGSLLLSAGGLLNSVADEMTAFAIAHAAGITFVFAGFLVTGSRRRPALRTVATGGDEVAPVSARSA
ncbi:MAG: hypothetical protein H0W25_02420 [Acidimicrobiia bacterium]|nr:hypothetical protein [Acidimicrobiia bacterium]